MNTPQAIPVPDRFHIMTHIHDAIDAFRRGGARRDKGTAQEALLTNSRLPLLKNTPNLTENQVVKL
jgi:transposase